jgi:hypothetical protein
MPFHEVPRLTRTVSVAEFHPPQNCVFIFGSSPEVRSAHIDAWRDSRADVRMIEISEEGRLAITLKENSVETRVALRSEQQFLQTIGPWTGPIYLDITGLSYHVWAPMLKALIAAQKVIHGVYVEPGEYNRTSVPTEGTIFDLSERILGVSPLPGFARLDERSVSNACFVPILGFEGTRLIHMNEHVQPTRDRTTPVIGVPGFRPEYPLVAYHGNRKILSETEAWTNVRYATANCPFDLFLLLRRLLEECDSQKLRVAPIGTKPHGLGAVLFAIKNPNDVEIIYDHPIRTPNRTTGRARICLYEISTFLGCLP